MRPATLIMFAMMRIFVWTWLVGLFGPSVMADDALARFEGGIGVMPVSSGVGTATTAEVVNRNIIRRVQPTGQIWVIRKLKAAVTTNGDIKGEGEGQVLGGGHHVGRATGQRVFATLMCETTARFTERHADLASVTLDPNGGFAIDDVLTAMPPIPGASPMLLIRNASGRKRFAAGILELDESRS